MCMMCSSGLLHKGQLDEVRWPRRFITRPVAISPPTSFEINFIIPKEVEVRLSWRLSHEASRLKSVVSTSKRVDRYEVKLK